MIYIAILMLLIIIALSYDFLGVKIGRSFFYIFVLFVLICLSGFRYKVGGDTYNYMYYHDFMPNLSQVLVYDVGIDKFQPLWVLLTAIAKSISDEFYALQILHALIVNTCIFIFVRNNTQYKYTAILFYYVALYPYFNFEILRESLAISVFLLSVRYFLKKNWLIYYALASLAFMFHYSAIILFFLPLIRFIKISPLAVPVVFLISAILNPYVIKYLPSMSLFGSSGMVAAYAENNYTLYGLASLFLFFAFIPSFVYYVSRYYLKITTTYDRLANIGLFFVSIIPLFYIFFRFYNYFSILFVLLACEILHKSARMPKLRNIKFVVVPLVFILFFTAYTFRYYGDTSKLAYSTSWYYYWYPYYSIFDPQVSVEREALVEGARIYNR